MSFRVPTLGWLVPWTSFLAATAFAECVVHSEYLHLEALLDLPGSAAGTALSGDYAYVAEFAEWSGVSCLEIVSLVNPRAPEVVGHIEIPTWGVRVAVAGDYAFVTEEGSEQESPALQAIDVSDPALPQTAAILPLPPGVRGVATLGSRALVANGEPGLQVVPDPGPHISLPPPSTDGVVARGRRWLPCDQCRGPQKQGSDREGR